MPQANPSVLGLVYFGFRYFGGEEASDNTLLELELKFYEEYAQRYDRMKKLETTIPLGWRIHPKRQRQLLDINRPWVDPPIVPCDFPPRLTDDHLLEMLEDHASVHRPFLTHSLAKRIAENAPEAYRHCNFVFLHEGPLDPTNFTQKWFGHRFFNNLERNEGPFYIHRSFLDKTTCSFGHDTIFRR